MMSWTRPTARMPKAAQVAERLGFSYQEKATKSFRGSVSDLPEIPGGAKVKPVITGELDGRELIIFEASYMVFTGQTMMQVAYTFFIVQAPAWPRTNIISRNFFGRLLARLGRAKGLQLESPEFNIRFKVTSDDEDFAIALLSPQMQEFLLTKTTVRWRISDGRVCLVYSGTLKSARIESSLQRFRDFWELVPKELENW